ncbi:sulfotransferase family protein [Williamsia sp. MIQD14]|uniref:sulfotransferase family protein n=1 Tax=Williamsia sp. MIQD14 TaxID=3425703 RepID=UPI003DA1048E
MSRPTVVIHVGLPKTGTTYLQDRLWRNRDTALRVGGLLYPGVEMSDHFHAAVHLQPDRYLDWVDPAHADAWGRMVAQMRGWPGTSLVSHELFSTATAEQARRVVADLDFADVHVVATVRDLARQLPSVWQENVKNQHTSTLDEFIESLRRDPIERQEPFWEFQDFVRILRTWGDGLPSDRIHLVTVPRSGSGPSASLWDRFTSVLGVDGAELDVPVPPSNAALTPPQVELLRALNTHLQPDTVAWDRYEWAVKRHLIGDILFDTVDRHGRSLTVDQSWWAAERSDAMIAAVVDAGFDIVGDTDDLRVDSVTGTDDDVDATGEPTPEETLEVAVAALARILATMPMPARHRGVRSRVGAVVRGGRRRAAALALRRRAR